MSDDQQFPKDQWDKIRATMESDGPAAVIAAMEAETDLLRRRQLYMFVTGQLAWEDWEGKTLDGYAEVTRWAIAESLRQAGLEDDTEVANRRTDLANVLSYNLSTKLADCWADDTEPREQRHFELGLSAADDCLRWRQQLDKPAQPFSIAWWAKGMHELSLGSTSAAVASFVKSLDYAREAIREKGDEEPSSTSHFGIALGEGYLGIAEHLAGSDADATRYHSALADFATMAENAEKKGDADFGAEQIRTVWTRYVTK